MIWITKAKAFMYRVNSINMLNESLQLSSAHSIEISLRDLREGKAGLDERRKKCLNRVPQTGNWANFEVNTLTTRDIAYLSAYTGHEFAILRGKKNDILYHGTNRDCIFDDELVPLLKNGKLRLYAHSHPDYSEIIPSNNDRAFLKSIKQESSIIVSWITGREQSFTSCLFDV